MKNKIIFIIAIIFMILVKYHVARGASIGGIINPTDGSAIRTIDNYTKGVPGINLRSLRSHRGTRTDTDRGSSNRMRSDSDSSNYTSDSELGYLSESAGIGSDSESDVGETSMRDMVLKKAPSLVNNSVNNVDAAKKAVVWNRDQDLKLLLQNGLSAQFFDKEEALRNAALYGYPAVVKVLIDAGTWVNAQNSEGMTALMYAVGAKADKGDTFKGNHEMVIEELLMRGAGFDAQNKQYSNVDISDIYGDTALIKAVRAGNAGVVRMLILAGADSELENMVDESALSIANDDMKKVIENALQEKKAFGQALLLKSKISDEWRLLPKELAGLVTEAASNPYGPDAIALKAALFVQQKSDEQDAAAQVEAIKRLSLDDAFVSEEGVREALDVD